MENINERNEEYESATFQVPPQFHSLLGKEITGNNITTKISRLKDKQKLTNEEQQVLRWLKGKDNAETNKIDAIKRIKMKTDAPGTKQGGNNFIDTHKKDRNNTNPTKVGGLADMRVKGKHSKVSDQIENNRVQYYESYNKEIEGMKYLIEYMNNNNNNKTI
jgi:hypothetical protein